MTPRPVRKYSVLTPEFDSPNSGKSRVESTTLELTREKTITPKLTKIMEGENVWSLQAGRHNLVKDAEGNYIFGSDGSLIVEDSVSHSIVSVPLTEQVLKFFGLNFGPVETETTAFSCVETCETGQSSEATPGPSMEAPKSAQVALWEHHQEVALIEMWKNHKPKFSNTQFKSSDVWRHIQSDLNSEVGTNYTVKQVENKWKNLRKNYMIYVDSTGPKNSGGEPLKKPKHFEALEEIFRKSPHVEPVAIASSRRSADDSPQQCESPVSPAPCASASSPVSDDGTDFGEGPVKRRKISKVQRELGSWAEKMQQHSEKKEEVRAERFNTLLGVYNRMAVAQEGVAASIGQLTQFLINRGQQQNQ